MSNEIPNDYIPLQGSERHPVAGAQRVGRADPNEIISVSISVRRRSDSPPLPDQNHWATMSPGQRKFISRQDFAARYGAAQADIDRVVKFARNHGLAVVETSIPKRTVVVSGKIQQMNRAFAVDLGQYESAAQKYRGREGHVHLPKDVADVVDGVFGLDNRQVVKPRACPGGTSALTPPQVAALYNFPKTTATGQTIGILEFGGGYALNDILSFFTGLGLTTPNLTDVSVDGATNSPVGSMTLPSNEDLEVILDIDVAGSVAQGANIAIYFAPNNEQGWRNAFYTAIHDTANAPSVISLSWGGSEDGEFWTTSAINNVSVVLQEAAALGVTILVDAGDWGSNGDPHVCDTKAHVGYPASDPWVTGCGGTYIANILGSYTEGTWNDTGATGGGVSDIFPLPSWQMGMNVPRSVNDGTTTGRGVPDVAGNASSCSGYVLWRYGEQTTPVGGTSAVPPLYAALIALIEAKVGYKVGYLNPTLYGHAGTNVFRDINDGVNNQWSGNCGPGTTATTQSYTSGPGWDACTGLGSIDGTELLNVIAAPLGPIGPLPPPSTPSGPLGPLPPPSTPSGPLGPLPPPSTPSGPLGPLPPPSTPSGPLGPLPPPSTPSGPLGPLPPPSTPSGPLGPLPPPSTPSGPLGPLPPHNRLESESSLNFLREYQARQAAATKSNGYIL
jgi:kumamolisin